MSFWLQCCVVDGPEILAQTSELSGEQSFWVVCRQRKHQQESSAKILNTLERTKNLLGKNGMNIDKTFERRRMNFDKSRINIDKTSEM